MYQYWYVDQNPRLFGFHKNVMMLTPFQVQMRCFDTILDLYFFLTDYVQRVPANLEDAFEIQDMNNVWKSVKRPYLHAPSLYCDEIPKVQAPGQNDG
jgi:hypothetical protein